jgi:hypothetical protein
MTAYCNSTVVGTAKVVDGKFMCSGLLRRGQQTKQLEMLVAVFSNVRNE